MGDILIFVGLFILGGAVVLAATIIEHGLMAIARALRK